MTGDFNAKNPSWGGQILNERGDELADLFLRLGMVWVNDNNSPPTFSSSNGESWVDLTLVNGPMLGNISKWEVLEIPSGSDHNYIKVAVYGNGNPVKQLTKKGEIKVLDKLRKDTWLKDMNNRPIISKHHLHHVITALCNKIEELSLLHAKIVTYRANEVK